MVQTADSIEIAAVATNFRAHLAEKERFCDRLERLADLLPDAANAQDCLILAQNIVPLVKRTHDFEELTVFPLLAQLRGAESETEAVLERLKYEHIGDEEFAHDICLSLRKFVTDRPHANVESLSWMLRGFFEGLRRHMAFERQYVLAHLEQRKA